MSLFVGFLYVLFVVSCLLLVIVILLQEGKGGGLSEAFGGVGGETFGHRAGGVNKFTSALAAIMIVSLIMIHSLRSETKSAGLMREKAAPGAGGVVNPGMPGNTGQPGPG
jgi:preprotein translocase subunit SecG